MTDYVVGDIQGCCDSLVNLLDKVNFKPEIDRLFCVGDLINRGPKSIETLELLHSLNDSVQVVLGNHDLHLISCFYQLRSLKKTDTAQTILTSPKAEYWIDWLRQQPLMIYEPEKDFIISHAGIYPKWSTEQALSLSNKFSEYLKSDNCMIFIEKIYGNNPNKYTESLSEDEKMRFSVNAFTRMRYCYKNGELDFSNKTFPSFDKKEQLLPWFSLKRKIPSTTRTIFGHWSSLGLYHHNNVICIDTGCVWGNELTLYNIDNDVFIQQSAID